MPQEWEMRREEKADIALEAVSRLGSGERGAGAPPETARDSWGWASRAEEGMGGLE